MIQPGPRPLYRALRILLAALVLTIAGWPAIPSWSQNQWPDKQWSDKQWSDKQWSDKQWSELDWSDSALASTASLPAVGDRPGSPPPGPETGPPLDPHSPTRLPATLQEWITLLAGLGDRGAGTPGNKQAAKIIEQAFGSLADDSGLDGLVIGRHSFAVPVQRYMSSSMTRLADGKHLELRPLRLNLLSAPAIAPPGLTGQVLYAGQGTFADFDGMSVQGAVVLMDMDSGKNWLNAATLGAAAVIYVDPGPDVIPAPRNIFEDKFEQTPIDFPRFWMTRGEAEDFFGDLKALRPDGPDVRVKLTSRIAWENTTTENIYCLIPGADPELAGELTVLQAFYDSTSHVPRRSPGADQALSMATLLTVAQGLSASPPRRTTLLLATSGQTQDAAGMREFVWALRTSPDKLADMLAQQTRREDRAKASLELLTSGDPFSPAIQADPDKTFLIRQAFQDVIKDRIDVLSTQLMRLRLERSTDPDAEPNPDLEQRIKDAATQRLALKRMRWVNAPRTMDLALPKAEQEQLQQLFQQAVARQQAIARDASTQAASLRDAQTLNRLLGELRMVASASLHLSSRGDGLGAFDKGWLYELTSTVARTRQFSTLDELLREAAASLKTPEGRDISGLFQDTLRPSRIRPWQSWLPDRPVLAAEPVALAGLPGFTLATVNDARAFWGTPYDLPRFMNLEYARDQAEVVAGLARVLMNDPIPDPRADPRDGFAELTARVNLLRQGELFPDQPATDAMFMVFQGPARLPTMVDTAGLFHAKGLVIRKQTIHKAILEGFTFDPSTGRAVHAVDKAKTGKDAYRVRIKTPDVKTDLIMFNVGQSTFFSMLEPRSFDYLYVPELIDARTEAQPLRFWYSRLDTRSSTLGSFFLEPDVPLKLTLSDNFINKKVVLLNADDEHPQGVGYRIRDWPTIPRTEFAAARDMWQLLTPRIQNLESKGIVNDRIREMRIQGRDALHRAEQAREDLRWSDFQRETGTSLAIASQVYNEVDQTQRDILVGVLFYVALFIPFSFCMERLIFGFTNIHKRIIAFIGFLTLIIAAVYAVHPAFQLTYSPMVVILAFFILGLSVLVAAIIFSRFEREMEELQRRSHHLKTMNISRSGAFAAAFILGVSNLRRRPLRTALTCITLTILTFTIMNFTAVKSVRQKGWSQFSSSASYQGAMMKYLGWRDMPVESWPTVSNFFGDQGVVAPRAWYVTENMTSPPMVPISSGTRSDIARGLIGLSHVEPRVSNLENILVAGDWFGPDDRNAVILPESMAAKLGVDSENPRQSTVTIWGLGFQVAAIMADNGLDTHPDLDGEPITPVFFPSEAARVISDVEAEAVEAGQDVILFQSRYQHVSGDQTVIIPARTLLSMGGGAGRLKALAAASTQGNQDMALAAELGERFGTMLFRGNDNGTAVFFATNAMSYQGASNILVPLLIAALIVLNTMIGSVHERRREIAVYTSVGLAPSHVAFLFLAEALALAVISVVSGYLLAQGAAAFLAGTPLWAGMTANYSSTAGVAAMAMVMLVVLASTLYPARMAAEIAIPDVNRSWTMPAAQGDQLEVVLPFLVKIEEQVCAGGFLMEYFRSHQDITHGAFSTDNLACAIIPSQVSLDSASQPPSPAARGYMLTLRVWLAPFDFGIRQTVELRLRPSSSYPGFQEIMVHIQREAGEHKIWQNQNKPFLNELRKQLLIWRSLDSQRRQTFEETFHRELARAHADPGMDAAS